MGTRADFYIGRGKEAQWIGSIAWDGHPENFVEIMATTDEAAYRKAVGDELAGRDDATHPTDGWPWPWEDSRTTDFAYAFDGGTVYTSCFGHGWDTFAEYQAERAEDAPERPEVEFPDMSGSKASAEAGSKRSGVLVFGMR